LKSDVKTIFSQVLVTHACNPSYSGGRDQEDRGLNTPQADSSARPYLKKPWWAGGVAKGEGPEFKPPVPPKKKKNPIFSVIKLKFLA
jgi:hypothetical protein